MRFTIKWEHKIILVIFQIHMLISCTMLNKKDIGISLTVSGEQFKPTKIEETIENFLYDFTIELSQYE